MHGTQWPVSIAHFHSVSVAGESAQSWFASARRSAQPAQSGAERGGDAREARRVSGAVSHQGE